MIDFSAVGETIADYATGAFDYVQNNEWAANAIAGAAVAGGNYLLQKDQQKFQQRQEDRAWNRKLELTKAPSLDGSKLDWSNLVDGGLTGSGLISEASKR